MYHPLKSAAITAAIVSVAIAQSLGAQSSTAAPPPFAVVEGVAIDSLHQDFLRGAILTVEGAVARATTDAQGRFRIDSIPPGVRRIQVIHPLLDTVGVSLLTAPLQLAAGQHMTLIVSMPSVSTILAMKCASAERSLGPVALLGTVGYAESQGPATGARVSLEWFEHRVSGKSVQRIPRQRTATVNDEGRFRICGLPEDASGTLTAIANGDSTSAIDIHVTGPIGVVGLEVPDPEPAAVAGGRIGRAELTGRVLDPSGSPLARARVSVASDTSYAVTGADGRFTIRNLLTGTRLVSVRRLGFEPTELPVALHATRPANITVTLGEFVALLDTVRIHAAAREIALDRIGFTRRKELGTGYFITPDEIDRRNAYSIPDLLTMAPMLRRQTVRGHTVIGGRGTKVNVGAGGNTSFSMNCVSYVLDGIPWNGGDVADFVYPSEVAAIEVYSKNFAPVQFRKGFDDCETVVIWTKAKIR